MGRAPTAGVQVTLTVRLLTPQGEVKESVFSTIISTVGTAQQDNTFLPQEGFLLSAHIQSTAASRGQCFVKCFLRKNPGASDQILGQLLFQGYVSSDDHLGYPQSPTESSLNGRGWTRSVLVADPPLRTGTLITVPAGVRWLIQSLFLDFTTDATAGNRSLYIAILDPSFHTVFYAGQSTTIGPSASISSSWAQNLPIGQFGSFYQSALPVDLVMTAGYSLEVQAVFVGPGDKISNEQLLVEEWVAR